MPFLIFTESETVGPHLFVLARLVECLCVPTGTPADRRPAPAAWGRTCQDSMGYYKCYFLWRRRYEEDTKWGALPGLGWKGKLTREGDL